jgi:hypothetical protein
MLHHPTVEQMPRPEIATLRFEARLGLLVDRALTEREDRRRTTRWRQAKRRQAAGLEDLA